MKIVTYLCTFLSLAYAFPSFRKQHLVFRSSTLENAAPLAEDDLDLFASNIGPLTSPELSPEDHSDITFTGTENSAILYDPLSSSSGPQNLFDNSLSSTGVSESTEQLCLENCPSLDSSIPLGLGSDDGNIFGANLDSDGTFIPLEDQVGSGSGPETWIEVHRGSGREKYSQSISLVPEESERQQGPGKEASTDRRVIGNDMLFSADDPAPVF